MRTELRKSSVIGKDSGGQSKTTALKEYPPAFCMSIASSLFRAMSSCPVDCMAPVQLDELMAKCCSMVRTDYGEALGADFVAM